MFSVSDIKETVYPAAYRRGKELYETAGVFDFSYELYLVDELPVADVRAKVRGINQEYYEVTATIDEEFGDVTNCNCGCEAFYNYEGMCKHCVAMLLNYVNKRTPMEILRLKRGQSTETPEAGEHPVGKMETAAPLKNLLSQYSMRATSKYMLPETIYGKVELEPYFEMDYGYARLEFKIGMETKYVLKNISAFLHSVQVNEKVHYGKKLDFYHHMEAFSEEAKRLIQDIPSIEVLEVPNEKQREASYKAALHECSGRSWISILKTLHQRKDERLAAGKKVTALDERYMRVAEQELYGELSVVLGIEKENMHDYIQEHIASA